MDYITTAEQDKIERKMRTFVAEWNHHHTSNARMATDDDGLVTCPALFVECAEGNIIVGYEGGEIIASAELVIADDMHASGAVGIESIVPADEADFAALVAEQCAVLEGAIAEYYASVPA